MRGGYGTSEHRSLAERAARRTTSEGVPENPARHCFVDGSPALLVEWRRAAEGWEGRVVTVAWDVLDGWVTVERWVPQARLQQG